METVLHGLPLMVMIAAFWFGPLPIVIRGFLRGFAGPHHVHRWFIPGQIGFACGALAAAVLWYDQALAIALFALLFLLAAIDWQWRWLPIEWTLGIAALALLNGFLTGEITITLMQMLVPSAALLIFRQLMSWALGKEALGLGDIWLLLGLGGFLPVFETFLLVGLAAILGLFEVVIRRYLSSSKRNLTGVSYGTHLCIVFAVFQYFPQIL
ncbi:prepilin peptidase [Yoonia sp. BS5-3]|uniref:Prepilin peptidase n=1 Tax=Yoonia phaeophyticola TaxID=3137369 RepID=A0ABZ2V8M3_9RHOB